MTVSVTLEPTMWAEAVRFDNGLKFVSVRIGSGTDEISLYVDPPNIGKFMDMLQHVLDQLDAMPGFDAVGAEAAIGRASASSSHGERLQPASAGKFHCKLEKSHEGEHEYELIETIQKGEAWNTCVLCLHYQPSASPTIALVAPPLGAEPDAACKHDGHKAHEICSKCALRVLDPRADEEVPF